MSEQGIDVSEAQHHGHHTINLFVDGVGVTTHAHRLNGLQIRELGARTASRFKTRLFPAMSGSSPITRRWSFITKSTSAPSLKSTSMASS